MPRLSNGGMWEDMRTLSSEKRQDSTIVAVTAVQEPLLRVGAVTAAQELAPALDGVGRVSQDLHDERGQDEGKNGDQNFHAVMVAGQCAHSVGIAPNPTPRRLLSH